MKRTCFLLVALLSIAKVFSNPSFTIGSNYYLTIFAYPHDLLKWPAPAVFLYYNPQRIPWQVGCSKR